MSDHLKIIFLSPLYMYFYVFISLVLFGGVEQFRKHLETLLENGQSIRISSGYHLFFLKKKKKYHTEHVPPVIVRVMLGMLHYSFFK